MPRQYLHPCPDIDLRDGGSTNVLLSSSEQTHHPFIDEVSSKVGSSFKLQTQHPACSVHGALQRRNCCKQSIMSLPKLLTQVIVSATSLLERKSSSAIAQNSSESNCDRGFLDEVLLTDLPSDPRKFLSADAILYCCKYTEQVRVEFNDWAAVSTLFV